MPTFDHAPFIVRALRSLLAQSFTDWELLIVDDGSPDDTREVIDPYLDDERIGYERLDRNRGLGAAINHALAKARARLIAYLPSDDVYDPSHLSSLASCLGAHPGAVLAYSGIRLELRSPGEDWREILSEARLPGYPLQLVQVMHRRTSERWVERDELVTDDLERMFWGKLGPFESFVGTRSISCQWVDHPRQRHKVIQEPRGGLNPYRYRFSVAQPLRFHPTVGNLLDESKHFARFLGRPRHPPAAHGLKILLVGELAFNPERILAFEERGHRLYGLWTPDAWCYNAVGPLPFGHVEELPRAGWQDAVRRVRPDVIYALLNFQAVPFAHRVLNEDLGVPFVWHFKESPFDCITNGTWPQLLELYSSADGKVYVNRELREWFSAVSPESVAEGHWLVLDGDLPKQEWFEGRPSPRLSESDGQIHTVLPGRPIGLEPRHVGEIARHGIHLHCYGSFRGGGGAAWIEEAERLAGGYLHRHPLAEQARWVSEFSRYDAGWLHVFRSRNGGDVLRAGWDDLNYPSRIATLMAAGLPMLQYDNRGSVVATQSLAIEEDLGLLFRDMEDLASQLRDQQTMARVRASVASRRRAFTFDRHVDRLIEFFQEVIAGAR